MSTAALPEQTLFDPGTPLDPGTPPTSVPAATSVPRTPPALVRPDDDAWPAPPARQAFFGLAGQLVEALAPSSEADPVAILVQLLVGVGSMLGRRAHYQVGASRHGTNEFVVLVGPSG